MKAALVAVVIALGLACARKGGDSDGPRPPPDGSPPAADGHADATLGASQVMPKDCFDIRECVHFCKTDMTCAAGCQSRAPAAAQAKYQAIDACSRKACPGQDMDCRCEAECIFPSPCAGDVQDCRLGRATDTFCELCL